MASQLSLTIPMVLFAGISIPSASAQLDFDWSLVSPFVVDTREIAWGDLDGDGLEDILIGAGIDNILVWSRNLGGGEFGRMRVVEPNLRVLEALLIFDVDGDGASDIVTGSDDSQGIHWYHGLGLGEFEVAQPISSTPLSVHRLATADMDSDGDPDIVACTGVPTRDIVWFENLGGGNFGAAATIVPIGGTFIARGVAVADVDMDGDPDVSFVDSTVGRVFSVENLGGGSFGSAQRVGPFLTEMNDVSFGDVDGDGELELVTAGRDNIAWFERAAGPALEWVLQHRTTIPRVAIFMDTADLDGDSREEVILSEISFGARLVSTDTASGMFDPNLVELPLDAEGRIVPADVDGDGFMDLISPGNECMASFGRAGGGFDDPRSLVSPFGAVTSYATGDIDGDGDIDVVSETRTPADSFLDGSAIVVYEKLSGLTFAPPRELVPLPVAGGLGSPSDPSLADLNGDGILDLIYAFRPATGLTMRVRFGTGGGSFGAEQELASGFPTGHYPYRSAEAVDVDGDGALDLIWAMASLSSFELNFIYVLFNDGTGQIESMSIVDQGIGHFLQQVKDLENDGLADLVVSTGTAGPIVVRGDAMSPSGFTTAIQAAGPSSGLMLSATTVDFDVDGDDDLVALLRVDGTSLERLVIHENLGAMLGPEQLLADLVLEAGLPRAIDWDFDGDEDLVFSDGRTPNVRWLESDPSGLQPLDLAFTLPPTNSGFGARPVLRFEDGDSDGDIDAFVSVTGRLRYLRNLTAFGTEVCGGNPNSTGVGASTTTSGTDLTQANQLVLTGSDLPPGSTTFFLVSRSTGMSQPPLSQGTLCLGGAIGRYSQADQIRSADTNGVARLALDLTMTPDPAAGIGAAVAGETLHFQGWYRDMNPASTSNFTSAVGVLLR